MTEAALENPSSGPSLQPLKELTLSSPYPTPLPPILASEEKGLLVRPLEHIDTAEKEDYTQQTKPKKKKIKGFVITDENIHRLEEMRAILVKKFYKVDYSLIINLAIEHYHNYLKREG